MLRNFIIAKKVQGASHIAANRKCQDSFKYEPVLQRSDKNADEESNILRSRGICIAAAADGHGSVKCPFSKEGSDFAVKVFCSIMSRLVRSAGNENDLILAFRKLSPEQVAKEVHKQWLDRVNRSYTQMLKKGLITEESNIMPAELFGTTLMGTVIGRDFIYAFQIGDGDISYIDDELVEHFIEPDHFLGTETYSLSNREPWKHAKSRFQMLDNRESAFMMMITTDGFANCYASDQIYLDTCRDYYESIKQYGPSRISEEIKKWLSSMSEEASGDDITLIAVGRVKEQFPEETSVQTAKERE